MSRSVCSDNTVAPFAAFAFPEFHAAQPSSPQKTSLYFALCRISSSSSDELLLLSRRLWSLKLRFFSLAPLRNALLACATWNNSSLNSLGRCRDASLAEESVVSCCDAIKVTRVNTYLGGHFLHFHLFHVSQNKAECVTSCLADDEK